MDRSSILRMYLAYDDEIGSLKGMRGLSSGAESFLANLHAYNADTTQTESLPWLFVCRTVESEFVPERVINAILLDADGAGLVAEFGKRAWSEGSFILYFTHQAKHFATRFCEQYGLGIVNLGDQGLVLRDFCGHKLHSSTENERNLTRQDAKLALSLD